ncbi:hypothetical protein W97_05251 [Coniosporium apollinis CBS 100218]|uniref:Spindle pole body-associated protein cut12 domain-containing protein n=1 Tax=Coniosporium apollinis (strain CBS 100218) TaxID=1168221 RepID=R7YVY5_CONA1|nr:uncharacterized protein W97_05251 [Coniosporium apollinis CBS 100218]EON66008.1 hypothetical protein W97_05251 [Coniosporium apollinis CBS 100218]
MLSWITGARITNVAEDLDAIEPSYIEPPETPAPVFAVRAFKHAIFGTPHPDEGGHRKTLVRRNEVQEERKTTQTVAEDRRPLLRQNSEESDQAKPNGILMTPGTAATRRKTVSFGAHVVDNEGKKSTVPGRSGLPNNCPGKFPSPWTPKAGDATAEPVRTKLTAALFEARDSSSKPKAKARAKDDADITLDVTEPRSESGRYWKEKYESYSEKSEKDVKKLITKQQLAKNYAKKKDEETMELATRLEDERKRHKKREKGLEAQMKDYQERLRQSMAENLRSSTEIAALKQQVASLEANLAKLEALAKETAIPELDKSSGIKTVATPSPTKPKNLDSRRRRSTTTLEGSSPSPSKPASTRARPTRRNTSPDPSLLLASQGLKALAEVTRSPLRPRTANQPEVATSPLRIRNMNINQENLSPKKPSSPLKHDASSPFRSRVDFDEVVSDLWAQANDSSIGAFDRLAMPVGIGGGGGGSGGGGGAGRPSPRKAPVRKRNAPVGNSDALLQPAHYNDVAAAATVSEDVVTITQHAAAPSAAARKPQEAPAPPFLTQHQPIDRPAQPREKDIASAAVEAVRPQRANTSALLDRTPDDGDDPLAQARKRVAERRRLKREGAVA